MADRRQIVERARQVVGLRLAARSILEPEPRKLLDAVCHDLRDEIGPSIPKKQAADLLGVSVTTLDKWIARGAIPESRRAGSSRAGVDAETVLRLAEVKALRDASGAEPSTLAAALEQLASKERSARQVEDAAELSYALTSIAAAGAPR